MRKVAGQLPGYCAPTLCFSQTISTEKDKPVTVVSYWPEEEHALTAQVLHGSDQVTKKTLWMSTMQLPQSLLTPVVLFTCILLAQPLQAAEPAPQRGYELLTTKEYLPPDFEQSTFEEIWQVWPEPLRSKARKATPAERWRMAFERYGLTVRPGDEAKEKPRPLQYVVSQQGQWTMNCFACHGGKLPVEDGATYPGSPNTGYMLQTFSEDIRATKLKQGKKLTRMDMGSLFLPLGGNRGVTNAVVFGALLMNYRDADLKVVTRPMPKIVHHDMDAPPWWHFKKRSHIYIDGFAPKGHRGLMQFMLVRENGAEKFREWEEDFRNVYAFIDSVKPPAYPFEIDQKLATAGQKVFNQNCATCHGTYGEDPQYPNKIVPIDEVGTDATRLYALTVPHRKHYGKSWFTDYGKDGIRADPGGYLAPPLDGVWASAPYLHNGSVPTLHHLFYPDERPKVWKRSSAKYDQQKLGFTVQTLDKLPAGLSTKAKREYFDTSLKGKDAGGHTFPAELAEDEKKALLEYLKTL